MVEVVPVFVVVWLPTPEDGCLKPISLRPISPSLSWSLALLNWVLSSIIVAMWWHVDYAECWGSCERQAPKFQWNETLDFPLKIFTYFDVTSSVSAYYFHGGISISLVPLVFATLRHSSGKYAPGRLETPFSVCSVYAGWHICLTQRTCQTCAIKVC